MSSSRSKASKPLNKKSTFITRRNVIIYILATICILGIVAGFTNTFTSDSHIWSGKYGETIVMEKEPPVNGTPADYDLLDNLRFTAYKIHHASHFRGESAGTASADIKLGTYTQYLTNTRVVDGDTVFAETISTSSLKNIAEQKYSYKDIVVYRPAASFSGSSFTYADTAYPMKYEDYAKKYGTIPNQLTKYIINEQTIIGVKDENAAVQKAANAGADGNGEVEFGFDVPSALVPDADGNYKFTLTLDPDGSTRYYRNEVRTLAGADQNPKFYSVKMTITVASDWTPISARAMEKYDIAIPVLGAMTCTGDVTEYFSEFDQAGDVPLKDFFQPYIDGVLNDPNYVPPQIEIPTVLSPSDYLASAFGPYLTGEKNLDLGIDVKAGDISAYDIKTSINLSNMNVDVALGNSLYARYANDRLYLKLNDLNGYIDTADIGKLMKDERMAALVGGMSNFDFKSLLGGGDLLDTLFKNCEMTTEDGVVCIDLPFELDASELSESLGKIKVRAALYIGEDDFALQSITGTVTIGGTEIVLYVSPLRSAPKMPSFATAVDLSPVLDVIPDAIATFTSPRLEIDGTLAYNGLDIGVWAYIDRTDGLKIDAMLNVLGIDVAVKYVDGEIAVNALGADIRGTASELPELIGAVTELIGGETPLDLSELLQKLKLLLPTTVNGYAEMLKSLTYADGTLAVKLGVIGIPVDISLSHSDGVITRLALGVNVDLLGIKADVAADLGISLPAKRDVVLPDCEYIAVSELTALVGKLKPYLAESNYEISFNASVIGEKLSLALNGDLVLDRTEGGVAAKGNLTVAGQNVSVIYAGGAAYAQLGNIKVKLATTDLSTLISDVIDFVTGMTGGNGISMPSVDVNAIASAVKRIDVKNGVITVELAIDGVAATATVDINAGSVSLTCEALGLGVSLDGTLVLTQQSHDVTPPTDGDEYIDVMSLENILGAASDALEHKGVEFTAAITVGDNTYSANIALSFEDGLKIRVTEDTLGAQITLIGGTAYIAVGDVRISGTLADVTTLFDEVKNNLPEIALPYLEKITSALGDLTSSFGDTDIKTVVETALAAITEFKQDGNGFAIKVEYNGINATLVIDKALACMTAAVNIAGGTINGLNTDLNVMLELNGIEIKPVDVTVDDESSYVAASEFVSMLRPILPLVKEKAFDLSLSVTAFGQTMTGTLYVDLGEYTLDTISAQAKLDIAGVPIAVTVKDKTLYADINNGKIKLAQPLDKAAIAELIARIDEALGTDLAATIAGLTDNTGFADLSVIDVLGAVALSPIEDGFELTVDISGVTVTADVHNNDGLLCGIDVYVTTADGDYTVLLTAETTNGVLSALRASDIAVGGTALGFELTVAAAQSKEVVVPTNCMSAYDVLDIIPSILDLVNSANGASSLTVDISAMRLDVGGKYMDITGVAEINLDPIAVRVDLVLFAGTPDAQQVTVVYDGGIAYITLGSIKLSFDIESDPASLFESIKPYLPQSLQSFDMSAIGGLSGLISNIKAVAQAESIEQAAAILFDANNAQNRSTLKQAADMIELFVNADGRLVASVTLLDVPFALTVNASPIVTNGGLDVKLDTGIMNFLSLGMTVSLSFRESSANIVAPADAAAYVPVVRFVTTVVDAVNTLTAKIPDVVTTDEYGNVTTVSETAFQVSTFSFDHDTFKVKTDAQGNTLTDEKTGRALIETDADGNKVVERHVTAYGKDGMDALRFSYVTTKVVAPNGKVTAGKRLAVEAHVVIEISDLAADGKLAQKLGFPIELDLYLAPTDAHPEGLAYLYYKEHNADEKYDGMGEKISIDYNSALQIVAALMDIVGADDETVDSLLGAYRLPIDTSVFDSMAIAGFDGVKTMLDSLAKAVNEALGGLNDVKAAWRMIKAAPDLDALINMFTAGDADAEKSAKALLASGIDHIKAAIAVFGTDDEEETEPETPAINGALFGKVVDAVEFAYAQTTTEDGKTVSSLSALLDNAVATGTSGHSDVVVSGTDSKIDSIVVNSRDELDGLDVNTARLNKFMLSFTTGKHVDIAIPADFDKSNASTGYADLSNIKHLLFDVMNTANMLEFDIGGKDKNLHVSILGIVDLDVTVNAKVKILDQSEYLPMLTEAEIAELKANNDDTLPVYMTAAIISLTYKENKVLLSYTTPNCTTQLYFFNDTIYVSGVKNWTTNLVGTTIRSVNYITVKYTLDDLSSMLNGSIADLLDKFVFYLMPLSDTFKNTVRNSVTKDNNSSYEGAPATIANIFKGYSYNNGQHTATIGLKELAQNSSLGDVTLMLTGENNDDDHGENANYHNNYIHALNVKLSLVSIVNITLDAYLNNASTDSNKNMVKTPLGDVQLANLKGLGSYGFNTAIKNVKNYSGWIEYSAL